MGNEMPNIVSLIVEDGVIENKGMEEENEAGTRIKNKRGFRVVDWERQSLRPNCRRSFA